MRRFLAAAAAVGLTLVGMVPAGAASGERPRTEIISRTPSGQASSAGASCRCAVSGDGRYVAFEAASANLGGSDLLWSVVVHDRLTHDNEVASVTTAGMPAPGEDSSISADGRYVAFSSRGVDLVDGDTNLARDIFVRDLLLDITTRVSVSASGAQANRESAYPSISADGMRIAFRSSASNLVAGSAGSQIYVRDLNASTTLLASRSAGGSPANAGAAYPMISADGTVVVFESSADNLISGDTNGQRDIYAYDFKTNTAHRASVASEGTQADDYSLGAVVSGDGRYVAYTSYADTLVSVPTPQGQVFLHDLATRHTSLMSRTSDGTAAANAHSASPEISTDGRYIVYETYATNLWPEAASGAEIAVVDRQTGIVSRASLTTSHSNPKAATLYPAIAGDASLVVWVTTDKLSPDDTNGINDVYGRTWKTAATPPQSPIAGSGLSPGQIHLRWREPKSDGGGQITGYNVYRSQSTQGPWTLIATTPNLTYSDSGRPLASITFYKITATNTFGESDPSTIVCATGGPGAPGLISHTGCTLLY